MAKIVTVYNNIGGVAKTTTLFNLAVKLSQMGKKYLLQIVIPNAQLLLSFSHPILKYLILQNFREHPSIKPLSHDLMENKN